MSRKSSITKALKALSLLTAFVALGLAALWPQAARAGAYTYGTTSQRTINAGILLLSGNPTPGLAASPDNKEPYVFYILNQRTDIKPFGWNIVNPHAPGAVTAEIQLRWDARTGKTNIYQLGQTVTQAMAAYWEVPLASTSSDDLSQYDVLFLSLESQVQFTAADAEKLRRFVDGGGTLWIEDSGVNGGVNAADLPFFRLQFDNTGSASYAQVNPVNRHPLLSSPFLLSLPEINSLGGQAPGAFHALDSTTATLAPQYTATVIGDSAGNAVVAAGAYGAGQIVVSCTGSANVINQYVGATPLDISATVGPNSGPFCAPAVQNAPTADLKFVANILNSGSTHQNEHQNGHQNGNDPAGIPSAQHTWTAVMGTTTPGNLTVGSTPGSSYAGAAVYGHLAFVTDSAGVLHAFDIYPAENLDNDAKNDPDEGIVDFDKGAPWDEVWATTALGPGASAPTVAIDAATRNVYVLVEDAKGGVNQFLVGGPSVTTSNFGTAPTATQLANSSGRGTYNGATMPAPAPTYYDGRVYAGGADGSLFVGTLNNATGNGGVFFVDPVAPTGGATADAVTASPTVGIVPDAKGANDILALVTTNKGLYSVFLGSRGESLTFVVGGSVAEYSTKLVSLTNSQLDRTAFVPRPYTLDVNGYPDITTYAPTLDAYPAKTFHTSSAVPGTLFADYDADLKLSVTGTPGSPNGPLTRTVVAAGDQMTTTALTPPAMPTVSTTTYVSAPALDRFGNVYYTVTTGIGTTTPDSVLFCVHDAPGSGAAHVNWRFRLPQTGDGAFTDADNTSYTLLENTGMTFTTTANGQAYPSAPVVDEQGNVYVLATGGGSTAVLCFNGLGTVSADLLSAGDQSSVANVAISQPIPSSAMVSEFGQPVANVGGGQYQLSGGTINFTNFAAQTFVGGAGGAHFLYPNLSEPYPITVSYNLGGGNRTPPSNDGGNSQTNTTVPLHTNLTWYTVLPTTATSGLTKVGNTLYFLDLTNLNAVPADVQTEGFTITNKYINPASTGTTGQPLLTTQNSFLNPSGNAANATAAVPASAGGALLVSGPGGLSAFTNQVTLVVDSNRVIEMDGSGNAQWAVDATTQTTLVPATNQVTTTTLELNRPSSVYELAPNDYLVADTGNNRAVRFDRAGKVVWELTKFDDTTTIAGFKTQALLKPGEPDTLNQPTSVQVTTSTDAGGDTVIHYLIADNGNFRVVEVDDVYAVKNNKLVLVGNHILRWVSHTHDVQGRDYRYQSANFYSVYDPVAAITKYYVAALVANKRVAPFTYTFTATPTAATYAAAAPSLLAPANQDANGGSIVLLDYDPDNFYGTTTGIFGTGNQADGFIGTSLDTASNIVTPITVNSFYVDLQTGTNAGKFDINTAATQAAASSPPVVPPSSAAVPATPLLIRNPRYLKVYTTNVNNKTVRHYLLADDNGAFDLTPGSLTLGTGASATTKTVFYAQWGFTQTDYQAVQTPISQEGVTGVTTIGNSPTTMQAQFDRTKLPFIASSIQQTGTDSVMDASTPTPKVVATVGRYLITNSYSQGEAANAVGPYYDPVNNPVQPGFSGEALEIQTLATNNGATIPLFLNEVHDNQYNVNSSPMIPLPMNGVSRFLGHTLSRPASSNTSPLNQPTFALRLQF